MFHYIRLKIYIIWGGGSLGLIVGSQGARARVILVLRECSWNALTVSLVFPGFDNTGSLGPPPRRMGYPPGSTMGDCLPFRCEE